MRHDLIIKHKYLIISKVLLFTKTGRVYGLMYTGIRKNNHRQAIAVYNGVVFSSKSKRC